MLASELRASDVIGRLQGIRRLLGSLSYTEQMEGFGGVPLWNVFTDGIVQSVFTIAAEFLLDDGALVVACRAEHLFKVISEACEFQFCHIWTLFLRMPSHTYVMDCDFTDSVATLIVALFVRDVDGPLPMPFYDRRADDIAADIDGYKATQRAGRAGRTRPGKCYRLYTEAVFENELPAVTVPEIQRSSLTGAVLHLKSLNLKEVNVLEFEFLDPPSRASLEDALQQLFIIDAIHEDGSITSLGKRMAALPLEPSLSRALLAAEEAGCLNEALTVAGMLSCESLFMAKSKKSTSHKRDLEFKNLPDGKGLGDHIQLLQIYEEWREDGFSSEWCEQHGIKTRSMMFARDVRKQLSQIVQWESKGSSRYRQKDPNMVALRRALCIGFSNRLAHRMQRHNGYRTLGVKSQLVQVHPSACSMEVDDDGLLPEWVVYNELVNTGRPYIRNVCVVKGSWCQPALMKLSNLSLSKLGGTQSDAVQNSQKEQQATVETETTVVETPSAVNKDLVAAARERFLARKQART
ncbi:hypothetical protein L7F22_065091 [Adiantum nelumboides]|nr:hypothetical protein [Adiantum nelumboides]